MPRALRIVLDVATSLRMSAGAMLLRNGSQSVLVHRTAPVMVIMVLFKVFQMEGAYLSFLWIKP